MHKMKPNIFIIVFLLICVSPAHLLAQTIEKTENIWSRSRLTGDWGGVRSDWEENGVTWDIDLLQTVQGVASGGIHENYESGGSTDIILTLDTEKMGLWPGGFLKLFAEGSWGNNIIRDTGAITSSSTDALFPLIDESEFTLTSVIFAQFLSETFGLFAGKIETLDGDANAFAGSRGKDQFMNQNFVLNPVTLVTVPYTALGGGFLYLLQEGEGYLNVTVLDPNGEPNTAGFDDAFDGGVVLTLETRFAVRPFDLPGHQLIGFVYSSEDFNKVQDYDRLLLPSDLTEVKPKNGSWCFYYNFDQYLSTESDHKQGWGIFGRFGMADDNTNPIEYFYSLGIGGQGIIPKRDKDSFGAGYYYMANNDEISDAISRFFFENKGQGGEIFYNIEVTPWLHCTLDFQVMDGSRKRGDTAFVTGLRMKVDL